jgi:serine/threonine-protein kinase
MPQEMTTNTIVGRYQVGERIGAGGMGAVYKARHLDLGREVALKVLPTELVSRPEMLERFRQEAKHAAKLRHEHIVTLFEIGQGNGVHFLAMEYVPGFNLHEYIDSKGRIDPEEARNLIIQATQALKLAHKEGIVHRDIKPSNFLLTLKEGKQFVKLADFGLARTVNEEDYKLTRPGTTVGSVDYISPEQARDSRAADIRSDIYSLGCTLYHMLAGRPPFNEGDMTARLLKHVEAKPTDVRELNPKVSPGLALVLDRMLAKKPADRQQTPQELLKDLERVDKNPIVDVKGALETLAAGEKNRPGRPKSGSKSTPMPGDMQALQNRNKKRSSVQLKADHSAHGAYGIAVWATLFAVFLGATVLICVILISDRNRRPVQPLDPHRIEAIENQVDSENAKGSR